MPQTTPPLALIEPLTLHPPRLAAELAGLRLLHITDLHIRKPNQRMQRLLAEMQSPAYGGCDLLLVTGDAMHRTGHEAAAAAYLTQLIEAAHPRRGAFGCFGNHDSVAFRELVSDLPITWLNDTAHRMADLPVNLLGLGCSPTNLHGDLLAALLNEAHDATTVPGADRLRILLSHMPTWLIPAAEAGIDLMFAGHTHGGQCRLPGRRTLYNSCRDWPLHHSCGVLRQHHTLAVVSRGLGESNFERLRFLCKPHAPLITLQPPDAIHLANPPREPTLIVPW